MLSLIAGCSSASSPPMSPAPDSGAACMEALSEATSALVGNQACSQDSDCVMVAAPSCVPLSVASTVPGEEAVANASLATVEHAFSVIEAESCSVCGDSDDSDDDFPFDEGLVPAASCQDGSCNVIAVRPPSQGEGTFEWACDGEDAGCGAGAYCEVDYDGTWDGCPGWAGYVTVVGTGQCVSATPTPPGSSCTTNRDCGFQENCQARTCATSCHIPQPTTCQPQCVLLSDNHGCLVCACDSDAGCPPPPPDAG